MAEEEIESPTPDPGAAAAGEASMEGGGSAAPGADQHPREAAHADAAQAEPLTMDQESGEAPTATPAAGPNVDLPSFQQVLADVEAGGIDLLHDVELNVKIELGRTHMLVEDVLRLAEGSVVELDKLAGDPVDVYVNDRLVARGEVLVLNDSFCVRINEIITEAYEGEEEGGEKDAGGEAARASDGAGLETAAH